MHFSLNETENFIRGYHGTLKQYKDSIFRGGFKPSKGDIHWLGEGVYFFRDDKKQAEIWAGFEQKKFLNKPIYDENPERFQKCVICWIASIRDDEFLNLDTRSGSEEFIKTARGVFKAYKRLNKEAAYEEWQLNNLFYKALDSKYKLIQRTFPVPSGYDKDDEIPFNSLMFLKTQEWGKDKKRKTKYIRTSLINGSQLVVRDTSILIPTNLSAYAC